MRFSNLVTSKHLLKTFFATLLFAVMMTSCATHNNAPKTSSQIIASLENEMLINTNWLRIHAAEALLDNGQRQSITELFRSEAETAPAPYRIGVWRVMARAVDTEKERQVYVERIRKAMLDPEAVDRISAAESLGKLNATCRADREPIQRWLVTADDATAAFPRWLLVLSSDESERSTEEMSLVQLLNSNDPVARLRTAFALGRLKTPSPDTLNRLQQRLNVEPTESIARIYLITALLLHTAQNTPAFNELKRLLVPYLNNGKANEQLEAGIVLGLLGRPDDISLLTPLFTSQEADARIGAANGTLRLLR